MLLRLLKNWTLPLAMLIGFLGYNYLIHISFITPYLIFMMLFLTFSKIELSELKVNKIQVFLLLIQTFGCIITYLLLLPIDRILAQSAMICVICPTATAAAVITQKLGGNAAIITTYTLLSNLLCALMVPILFPIVEPNESLNFLSAFLVISRKVFLLLIMPFILSIIIRKVSVKSHQFLQKISYLSFYIWGIALAIVMGATVYALVNNGSSIRIEIQIAIVSLLVCVIQFIIGKKIGSKYNLRISSGQALGQKNTILAIWMANTYLNPIAAIGPGAYVLWQNSINSWQLWKSQKKEKEKGVEN